MVPASDTDASPFQEFLERCREEHEQTQRELDEIDLLVQQTTGEVERLAIRNTQATNQLRQVEASIETVPRSDMQEAYSRVLDTQQRLFTMRGQLEKLRSDQKNVTLRLNTLRDITEHTAQAEHSHRESAEARDDSAQASVVRIIEAQERERRRLSRQMHDGPAQSLTNLILQAEICERLFDADPEQARAELNNLKNSVVGTFQKVKGFILNLRPMMLDDLGLVPTLRRYLESFSENTGVETDLTLMGTERRFAPHKEVTAFRIVQELLNNASEHGGARSARILLDLEGDTLKLTYDDDGKRLEITDALTSHEAERLGLATMRERVEMLGGEIHFDEDRGKATRVNLHLPIS